jgi:hypothetical protein
MGQIDKISNLGGKKKVKKKTTTTKISYRSKA